MDRVELADLARQVMSERGLRPEFPPDALAQAKDLRKAAPVAGAPRDLRALRWCSIDNDDSRDLDQLTTGSREDGRIRVLVAVADVDALVPRNSPIDRHAAHNTTSVYTAGGVFPMLPERLSTDLTSLNEEEDRMAVVASMLVTPDGEIEGGEIFRAAVRNHAKLAYDSLAAWLETPAAMPRRVKDVPDLAEVLRVQDEAAQALRLRRHERGALVLQTLEPRAVFEGDRLVDLRADGINRARQLIEELMIATNQVIAGFLGEKDVPSLRRVVVRPRRWDRIVSVAAERGTRLPDAPDSRALADFLATQRRKDPLRFPDLSLVIVKLLGSGEYVVERGGSGPGHFGLAVRDYAHSTAPNRRFPDLVTQRIVKALLARAPQPYAAGELVGLAAHCTDAEDEAAKVERHLRKAAAALLLESRIGESFDAVVTGASEKGTWARLLHPPVEGKIVRGHRGLDVGDAVRVRLVGVEVQRGFIDFARA
jgi:exoribonuclease-2